MKYFFYFSHNPFITLHVFKESILKKQAQDKIGTSFLLSEILICYCLSYCSVTHPVKIEKRNYSQIGNRSYQLTHDWQIGRHWLAGNSFFPCWRIFISGFSKTLGINIEGLNSLLHGIKLFI